jgi:hypothetical protein
LAEDGGTCGGRSERTRRDWNPEYARRFHKGDLLAAYNRSPRIGGKQVAIIRLKADPYLESTADAPPEDYAGEGFDYLSELGKKVDGLPPDTLWRLAPAGHGGGVVGRALRSW